MADNDPTAAVLAELESKAASLEGQLAALTRRVRTAEESLGNAASVLANATGRPAGSMRGLANVQALSAAVAELARRVARGAAASPNPLAAKANKSEVDFLRMSCESLKARIADLERALAAAGIDPITVRGVEPEGFRDESHGAGPNDVVVKGAADDLAAAFAESMRTPPAGER